MCVNRHSLGFSRGNDFPVDSECGCSRGLDCTLALQCELTQMSVYVPLRSAEKRNKAIVTQTNSPSFW